MFQTDCIFDIRPDIEIAEIKELVEDIDIYKSSGGRAIPMRIYKGMLLILTEQIAFLFNLSLKTGKIPRIWKSGVITPLPKKGHNTILNNIRPITISHVCGKLLEKADAYRLTNYLELNQLLCPNRMGFRSGRSTALAISKLVRHINRAQNEHLLTAALYIDFSKAFDCIKPALLLDKLPYCGLEPSIISWLRNYFSDRTQCVRIGECISRQKLCIHTCMEFHRGPFLVPCYLFCSSM